MSYFYCISCENIVTPFKPCIGHWHQDRKSKHMGVIISNKPIVQATIEKVRKNILPCSHILEHMDMVIVLYLMESNKNLIYIGL